MEISTSVGVLAILAQNWPKFRPLLGLFSRICKKLDRDPKLLNSTWAFWLKFSFFCPNRVFLHYIRCVTKIKNCSGFVKAHRILKVWSLLSPKIIFSSKWVMQKRSMGQISAEPLVHNSIKFFSKHLNFLLLKFLSYSELFRQIHFYSSNLNKVPL